VDFVLLKTFLKVAAVGGITKSADGLFITQSAVSRRIKQLEEYVGSPLFERTGTLLKLTTAGHLLIDKGRKMLEIRHAFFDELALQKGRQTLSFCCTPSLGMNRLSGFLSSFAADHSKNIEFSCVFTMPEEAIAGIDSGRFDLALIDHCDGLELKDHLIHHLPDDEMVFVSSPSLGISRAELEIERLFQERLYLKNKNGCAKRFIEMNLLAMGRSFDDFASVIFFDDLLFLTDEVMAGKGISFVSKGFVRKELQNGQLLAHKVLGFNHFRHRSLVIGRENLSPLVESFVDGLFAEFHITSENPTGI
jgi:DNA-binding transcriptional LysR family regulator